MTGTSFFPLYYSYIPTKNFVKQIVLNIVYNYRYRKTKLQTLVREFLGERIQENTSGHCSTEDSQASMKLVQLKLANSVDFGDAVLLGRCNMEILKMEPEKMTDDQRSLKTEIQKYATSIFKYVVKDKKTAAIVGNGEVMNEYSKYLTSSINIMDDENFSKNDQVCNQVFNLKSATYINNI